MEPQPVPPIRLVTVLPVPPDVAWAYLTDPGRVAEWFTEASEVGEIGSTYRLDFGEGSVVEGPVVAVEPSRRFAHGWAWLDAEPRQETLVTWTLRPAAAGGSELELVHDGWDEAGADEAIRDDHEAYWSGYLDDLHDLLEDVVSS
ncbi:MAG: SRPBCC domain-containing protein [Chloroflexi bacterium]|nr:SRPBCC domain-containing protein [Chloroflexota bacterium]